LLLLSKWLKSQSPNHAILPKIAQSPWSSTTAA
jgi:hypothetical protein